MGIIKEIILFFKRLFNKQEDIKMIEAPKDTDFKEEKDKFVKSLKVKFKKNKVETMICVGDGLGLQNGIKY